MPTVVRRGEVFSQKTPKRKKKPCTSTGLHHRGRDARRRRFRVDYVQVVPSRPTVPNPNAMVDDTRDAHDHLHQRRSDASTSRALVRNFRQMFLQKNKILQKFCFIFPTNVLPRRFDCDGSDKVAFGVCERSDHALACVAHVQRVNGFEPTAALFFRKFAPREELEHDASVALAIEHHDEHARHASRDFFAGCILRQNQILELRAHLPRRVQVWVVRSGRTFRLVIFPRSGLAFDAAVVDQLASAALLKPRAALRTVLARVLERRQVPLGQHRLGKRDLHPSHFFFA